MKNKRIRTIIIFIVAISLSLIPILFAGRLIYHITYGMYTDIMFPSVDARQVISAESFELAWSSSVRASLNLKDSGKVNDHYRVFMYLNDEYIVMSTVEFERILIPSLYLTSFDAETGQVQWKTDISDRTDAVGNNSGDIVLIAGGYPPRSELCLQTLSYCEAARVISYDALSGEENWSYSRENMNGATAFTVDDENISVRGNATGSSHSEEFSLDVNTGEELAFQSLQEEPFPKHLYRISERLGHEDDIVSNYAESEDALFYITDSNNTMLWAVDQNTEQIIGQVQFDSDDLMYSISPMVVAHNDMVVVYFGDNEQLFVFDFVPEK